MSLLLDEHADFLPEVHNIRSPHHIFNGILHPALRLGCPLFQVAVSTPDAAPAAPTEPEVAAESDVASASAETVETSPFMVDVANLIK